MNIFKRQYRVVNSIRGDRYRVQYKTFLSFIWKNHLGTHSSLQKAIEFIEYIKKTG